MLCDVLILIILVLGLFILKMKEISESIVHCRSEPKKIVFSRGPNSNDVVSPPPTLSYTPHKID